MGDIAMLGLGVDSSQVKTGTVALNQLTGAAGAASTAARQLAGATNAEAAGHKAAAAAAQVHNAALMAQNTVIRSSMQQRTMMIYQLNDVAVSLASGMNPAMVALQQGSQILQGGFAPALKTIGDLATGLVTKFWPVAAAVGAVTAVFAGLTYEINKSADVQVGTIDVMLAAWGMFADQVGAIVGPVWTWMVDSFRWLWEQISPATNGLIGGFVGAYEAIKATWSQLPGAIGDLAAQAAQGTIDAVVWMVNEVRVKIIELLQMAGPVLAILPGASPLASALAGMLANGPLTAPTVPNPNAGKAAAAAADATGAFMGAQRDYVGGAIGALSERAQQVALARAEVEELGGAASAANDNVKALADDGMTKLSATASAMTDALSGLGSGLWGAIRKGGDVLGNIMDMLMSKVDTLIGKLLDDSIETLLFGGAAGGGGVLSSLLGMFANGGVFSAGHQVQAFARGGVVDSPTLFPVAKGMGLMGEAGPEAIMPLSRGSDGKLGVKAANQNTGGGGSMHVTIGIAADGNGNITPFVQKIARQEAAPMVQRGAAQTYEAVKRSVGGWQNEMQVHGGIG